MAKTVVKTDYAGLVAEQRAIIAGSTDKSVIEKAKSEIARLERNQASTELKAGQKEAFVSGFKALMAERDALIAASGKKDYAASVEVLEAIDYFTARVNGTRAGGGLFEELFGIAKSAAKAGDKSREAVFAPTDSAFARKAAIKAASELLKKIAKDGIIAAIGDDGFITITVVNKA